MEKKEKLFLSILERHKGIVYKVANTYVSHPDDIDDLIQEITLQIWISLDRYDDLYKWSTWIYRIALNTSISYHRKNGARRRQTVRLTPVISCSDEQESDYSNEDFQMLNRFIRELKEIDRAIILLHLDGFKTQEIAEMINTSQTNVTTRIYRIKKKLKLKFDQYKNEMHGKL